jgi:SAM-dependent methyltransferase
MSVIYQAVNKSVLTKVPENSQRILDVGCGAGNLGRALKRRANRHVTGITYSDDEAAIARQVLDEVLVTDLNALDTKTLPKFDIIICSHVLEHLYHPEVLLADLKNNLDKDGKIIVVLPNILHWKQRLKFLKGDFKYTETGPLDRTHYRFYDWQTAIDLVQSAGLKVTVYEANGYFPLASKLLPFLESRLNAFAIAKMPGLFGLQFTIVAEQLDE